MSALLLVPYGFNFQKYTSVQRVTYFIWMILTISITAFTAVKLYAKHYNSHNSEVKSGTDQTPDSERAL